MNQTDFTRVRSAIYGLLELGELELYCPACPDPPIGFHTKLRDDVRVVRQFLNEVRPDPGRFFTSPNQRRRGQNFYKVSNGDLADKI